MSNLFNQAKDLGISAPYAKGFMAYDDVNGQVVVNTKRTAAQLAMDATLTPNVGIPAALTTFLSPEVVSVLVSPNNATKLAVETKRGDFTTDFYQFPVEEIVGGVQPYSDYDHAVSTDVNYNYPSRENFRFQTSIKFGDLEVAKASVAKVALVARKQRAAASTIAKAANRFYLFGVQGKALYGLLNDPNLNATISPITVGENSTWAAKTAADAGNSANLVYADINKLVNELSTKAGGYFDANSPMVLGISNTKFQYLSMANTYGVTALQLIKANYPNLTVEQVPELSTAAGDMLYLTLKEVDGVSVAEAAYSEKYILGRLVAHESAFSQKASAGTYGAVIKQPAFIATMTGI
mgnify:FL=1|jgi:hypothetical protein